MWPREEEPTVCTGIQCCCAPDGSLTKKPEINLGPFHIPKSFNSPLSLLMTGAYDIKKLYPMSLRQSHCRGKIKPIKFQFLWEVLWGTQRRVQRIFQADDQ